MNNLNSKILKKFSQYTINELITNLESLVEKYGNVPIVYWDQNAAVKFKYFDLGALQYDSTQQVLLFGGFHTNGDEYFDLDQTQDLKIASQHCVNDLINTLKFFAGKYDNIPIVYWDQNSIVKFDKCETLYKYDDAQQVLMFGGFHVNGDDFYDF